MDAHGFGAVTYIYNEPRGVIGVNNSENVSQMPNAAWLNAGYFSHASGLVPNHALVSRGELRIDQRRQQK